MNPEEALTMGKLLNELQSVDTVKLVLTGCGESIYGSREVYEAIRPFVEKQVAKKPVIAESAPSYVLGKKVYTGYKACGVCGDVVGGGCAEKSNYCSECGNKVDWSEE